MRFTLAMVLWIGLLKVTPAATTYYVATNGAGGDFLSWGTAASNIQDAISKATTANDIVLVSNGVYETGGVTNWPSGSARTNRVAITNAITVMSANSNPANTIINGVWDVPTTTNHCGPAAVRCVYMAANSKLIGFMLTNGATDAVVGESGCGGGVHCPVITSPIISNCVIAGNTAYRVGGGVYYGTLYNCTVSGNSAVGHIYSGTGGAYHSIMYNCLVIANSAEYGCGGVAYCTMYSCTLTGNLATNSSGCGGGGGSGLTLYNCLLTGNSAKNGGGMYSYDSKLYNCTIVSNYASLNGGGVYDCPQLYNCIVYFNRTGSSGSNWANGSYICCFTNSCTAPTTTVWADNNITDNPMFADTNTANYRLAANSPCINKGTNYSWLSDGSAASKDLDGRTRLRYGTVDMGAYERIHDGTVYGFR